MGEYGGVASDPDINKYSQKDLQELTESGIGEGMRASVVWVALIVLIIVVTFLIIKGRKAIKSTGQ